MMEIEDQVIQKALRDRDKNIFTEITSPNIFESHANRAIWSVAIKLFSNGFDCSFIDIHSEINKNGFKHKDLLHKKLKEIEDGIYWYDESSLDILKNDWQYRNFKILGNKLLQVGTSAYTLKEANEDIIKYYELIKNIDNEKKMFVSLRDIEKIIFERKEDDIKNKVFVKDKILKQIYGEYLLPRFYIVAGLPSLGKNIVVDRLVCELMHTYKGVYFSYDNSAVETGYMLDNILTGIPYVVIESEILEDYQRQRLIDIRPLYENIWITSKRVNIDKIRVILEKFKNNKQWEDIKYFVIDYFQNIPFRTNSRNEVTEYEHASREINKICNDLGLTAIIISQSRDKPREDYVKFYLGDLKWCGGLAQDSFCVIGIEGNRNESKRTIKIAKHKRGKPISFDVEFNFSTKDIISWAPRG